MKIKKPKLTLKRAAQRLRQQAVESDFFTSLAYPLYNQAEIDEARFTAEDILAQLSKPKEGRTEEQAGRHRALVALFMFKATIVGIANFLEMMTKMKGGTSNADHERDDRGPSQGTEAERDSPPSGGDREPGVPGGSEPDPGAGDVLGDSGLEYSADETDGDLDNPRRDDLDVR